MFITRKMIRNLIFALVGIALLAVIALVAYGVVAPSGAENNQQVVEQQNEVAPVVTEAPAQQTNVADSAEYQALMAQVQQLQQQVEQQNEVVPVATEVPVEQTAEYQALMAMVAELQQQLEQQNEVAPVVTEAPVQVVTELPTQQEVVPVLVTPVPAQEQLPTPVVIRSSDINLIGQNTEGKPFVFAIYEADLSKVQFEEVVVNEWNGLNIVRNTEGVVVQIWGRETQGKGRSASKAVSDKKAQAFFNGEGLLKKDAAREGWNKDGKGVATMQLTDVRIVKLAGEQHYRLVIVGKASKGGNGGNGNQPSATPVPPTSTPTSNPTTAPTSTPTTTPTTAPTTQPTQVPVTQPPAETTTPAPTTTPTGKPPEVPVTQPPAETVAPVTQPTAEPVQPTQTPGEQLPTASPVTQPTAEPQGGTTTGNGEQQLPTASPVTQPGAESQGTTGTPVTQPGAESQAATGTQPVGQPVGQPGAEPTAAPATGDDLSWVGI